jgi:hypothetical protein
MWRRPILLLVLMAMGAGAQAQPVPAADPPIEQVIVTAPRLSAEIKSFVQSYATRALSGTGTITRWHVGICAAVTGFARKADNDFVTARIHQLATEVGAPVAPVPCRADIDVYFTTQPQALLDSIRLHGGARLLTPTPSRASSIAAFTHPIQAWYATATREEYSGTLSFDDNDDNGWSGCVCDIGPPPSGPGVRMREGDALRAGARSEMAHVTVIADVNQTKDYRFSAVADYIAMLALTQIKVADACQELPSVTNLIFPGCAAPDQASDADLAYLKGIYTIDPGAGLGSQQQDIAAEMEKLLAPLQSAN